MSNLYKDIRPKLQSGDVILFEPHNLLGDIITYGTGSSWGHCSIIWKPEPTELDGLDRVFVLEAQYPQGVRVRAVSQCGNFDWISMGGKWNSKAANFAFKELGLGYGYINALRAGLGLPPKGQNVFCSEYAAEVIMAADDTLKLSMSGITPGALANDLLDLGKTIVRVHN